MKTKEELNKLKEEYESLNKKLSSLSEEELKEVTGGTTYWDVNVKAQSIDIEQYNTWEVIPTTT